MNSTRRLVVHLDRLEKNFKKLKQICPHPKILFMVKANAYGHGILPLSHFVIHHLGIEELGCASLEEAKLIRREISRKKVDLYIFSDFQKGLREDHSFENDPHLIPVLSDWSDLEFILKEASSIPLCLKFNTGMNRLGFEFEEVEKVIARLVRSDRKSVYHLMTHFANATFSMETHKQNRDQIKKFKQIKSLFLSKGIEIERSSCANSGAIEQGVGLEESHVRPGLMLYGPSSLADELKKEKEKVWRGELISTWETSFIKVREIQKGTPIGYGGIPVERDGVLGVIPLGYGDGLVESFRGAHFMHGHLEGEFVGKINMDISQILFPKGSHLQVGERVMIWDSHPKTLERLSRESGQSPYQIFTQLSARIWREYRLE